MVLGLFFLGGGCWGVSGGAMVVVWVDFGDGWVGIGGWVLMVSFFAMGFDFGMGIDCVHGGCGWWHFYFLFFM